MRQRPSGPAAQRPSGPAAQRPSGLKCARRPVGSRRPDPSISAVSPPRLEPRPGRTRLSLRLPALALLLGALSLFHAAPAAAQTTVTLSVSTNSVTEGSSVTVTATLPAVAAADVTIPVTVTLDSAETADLDATNLAFLRLGLAFIEGTATASVVLATEQDDDTQDEKFTVALGTLPTGYTAGTTTSVTVTILDDETKPTVTLSVSTNSVTEGSSVTVTATLPANAAADVTIPVTVTLDSAETADLDATNLALLKLGIGFTAGTLTSSVTLATQQDTDKDDETFTVAIDTPKLAELGYAAGAVTSVTVTIQDDDRAELDDVNPAELEVKFGDIELLIGPNDGLDANRRESSPNWVHVSPTMRRIDLKLTWSDTSITTPVTGSVRYVFHGENGPGLTWANSGDMAKLNMYSSQGSWGYPRVTITVGNNTEYRIQFISNGDWQNANNLLGQLRLTTSGQ